MYRTTKKKLVRRVGVSTAVALSIAATGIGVANAATTSQAVNHAKSVHPSASRARTSVTLPANCSLGVVSAVTSSSITVKEPSGTSTTYSYNSSTSITKERSSASTADLSVGESVMLRASTSDASTLTSIDIELPSVMGRVSAVSGDVITVSGPDGSTSTVVVSGSTAYSKDGATVSVSDVTVGSMIFAQVTLASDGTTLDASTIGIGMAAHGGPGRPGPGPGPGTGPGLVR